MTFSLDQLNDLHRILARCGESPMNSEWDGKPADPYHAQLVRDTNSLDDWARKLRDSIADEIGAVFDSDHEKYVIVG